MLIGPFSATVSEYNGEPNILEFCGEKFKIADNVGAMALLEFAAAAKSGLDSSDLDGLAAMHSMIQDTLAEDEFRDPTDKEKEAGVTEPILFNSEWDRFRRVAKKHKASVPLLFEVCTAIYGVLSNRPLDMEKNSPSGQLNQNTSLSSNSEPTPLLEISTDVATKKPVNKRTKATG